MKKGANNNKNGNFIQNLKGAKVLKPQAIKCTSIKEEGMPRYKLKPCKVALNQKPQRE